MKAGPENSTNLTMGGADAAKREPAPNAPAADRKEIVTGSASVTTKDPIDASHRAVDRVTGLKGRIDQRSEYPETSSNQPHAQVVVRVPADKTDEFIKGLSDFGTVASINVSRNDVTMQYQDVSARQKALQTSVNRLQTLLAQASQTSDLIQIETALSQRQAELDGLTAQLRSLNDQIDLSTLTLDFATIATRAPGEPDTFWSGVLAGWHSMISALHTAWVNLGRAIPWIGLLVLIGGAGWALIRALLSRKKRAVDAGDRPRS